MWPRLHGAPALAERLLFDGRPTMIRQEGLPLGELCDEMGQAAPWDVDLALPDTMRDGSYQDHYRRQEQRAECRGLLHSNGWKALRDPMMATEGLPLHRASIVTGTLTAAQTVTLDEAWPLTPTQVRGVAELTSPVSGGRPLGP